MTKKEAVRLVMGWDEYLESLHQRSSTTLAEEYGIETKKTFNKGPCSCGHDTEPDNEQTVAFVKGWMGEKKKLKNKK